MHSNIEQLFPYLDEIFIQFYDQLLSHEKLKIFFRDDDQIRGLVEKQKAYFKSSIFFDEKTLASSGEKLGKFHYDLKIPYVYFIKGTNLLNELMMKKALCNQLETDVFFSIHSYLKILNNSLAKGYLCRSIDSDDKDIDSFIDCFKKIEGPIKCLLIEQLEWLKKIFNTIRGCCRFDSGPCVKI